MNLGTLATVCLIEGVCLIWCPLKTGFNIGGLLKLSTPSTHLTDKIF